VAGILLQRCLKQQSRTVSAHDLKSRTPSHVLRPIAVNTIWLLALAPAFDDDTQLSSIQHAPLSGRIIEGFISGETPVSKRLAKLSL